MAADEAGLVHGGFVFGLADYAAMLAVNHPHVVLGAAQVRFVKPVAVGDRLLAVADVLVRGDHRRPEEDDEDTEEDSEEDGESDEAEDQDRRQRRVRVNVLRGEEVVMSGEFLCFILDQHVLGTPS